MRFLIFALFTFLFSLCELKCYSQTNGTVQIYQEPGISDLLNKHKAFYEKLDGVYGYRVQIFFDSGNSARGKANSIKAEFNGKYADEESYLTFQQPYFKVRVGDFRNRLEAECFMKKIEGSFSQSFVVKDKISFPKLGN
ncbi:MAG: SPOR domain-containing protein [Bacteroidota bacterium]